MKDPSSLIRGEWIMKTGHFLFIWVFFWVVYVTCSSDGVDLVLGLGLLCLWEYVGCHHGPSSFTRLASRHAP